MLSNLSLTLVFFERIHLLEFNCIVLHQILDLRLVLLVR